jgi:hypothetical protein
MGEPHSFSVEFCAAGPASPGFNRGAADFTGVLPTLSTNSTIKTNSTSENTALSRMKT